MIEDIDVAMGEAHEIEQPPQESSREVEDQNAQENVKKDVCIAPKIELEGKQVGFCAEAYLLAFEFDLGRYADILLNVFLGILIFYFPGGFLWRLFYFMCFSHCYIYVFDHWKVINCIPSLKIVSMTVDWYAQVV